MVRSLSIGLIALLLNSAVVPAGANPTTDWDAIGVAYAPPPPAGQREMALLHAAMFDAVNSIERRYRPYLVQLSAPTGASAEAAAVAAAAAVLKTFHPEKTAEIDSRLSSSLAAIPDGPGKLNGIELGGAVAKKLLLERSNDGSSAPDAYRPNTRPGVYVPTPITVGSSWPNMVPFALTSPSQYRPGPPVALASDEWTADFNEVKEYGGKSSTKRTPWQTETARFWLMVGPQAYHPLARQIVEAKQMNLIDSARFMALFAIALTDAYVASYDAKYHYQFWRPITAIRNGDIDGNPDTERDPTWQPLDNTPLHPEYPCAHCVQSGAAVAIAQCALGANEVPELSMSSPTAPGVTHRWKDLRAFEEEVAQARIWAGFHYRFSTRVGTDLGHKVGRYVCETSLRPIDVAVRP